MSSALRQKKRSRSTKGNGFTDESQPTSEARYRVSETQWKKNDALLFEVRAISRTPSNKAASVNTIITGMNSDDNVVQLSAAIACNKLVANAKDPSIENMISMGIIPRCIEFLSFHNNSALQFEAAKILAELTSTTSKRTMAVVNNRAVPKLVMLLKSPANTVAEQAVWALGNIAGDCSGARDEVLKEHCMPLLLNLIESNTAVIFAKNIVRTCANLCDGYNPPPPAETVETALMIFERLINFGDEEIYSHVCRALSSLTGEKNSSIQTIVDSGVVAKITPLLVSGNTNVVIAALKVLENISRGNHSQIDSIINAGGLERLKLLLEHKNQKIVKASASIITKIFAGTFEQVQRLIDAKICLPLYKVLVQGNGKTQVGESADLAVANMVDDKSMSQVPLEIQERLLTPFCRLLASNDDQISRQILNHLLRPCCNFGIKQEYY